MRFADYAKIYLTAGNGGDGMVHFRREKYVPRGGPDGGDGGNGGHIILRGNCQLHTLLDLRYRKFIKAGHGAPGHTSRKTGKGGEDVLLDVPLGTVVYDSNTRERIGEITEEDQQILVAKGGDGGLGNWHFKSATNQTPHHAQHGKPGEEKVIELELKLMADVGLVGFPNAGKSTLLSSISEARPKVADYPFTTLEPNLGVVTFGDYRSFVMADIPGIIEEAHTGKGLGLQFLRHIERNSILLFTISSDTNIEGEYRALLHELESYRPDLLEKPRLLAITKMDLRENYHTEELWMPEDVETIPISAATGYNLDTMKERIWEMIQHEKERTSSQSLDQSDADRGDWEKHSEEPE